MSERPAGTPSCAAILVYEPYGPQIDHRFFHSSFRLRTAHVVIYPFAGQGVPRICVFSYRIWLVMYMKVWPSTVGSISEKLIQSNSARPHLTVDYGIPHGNTTTLAAILSCRSWHLPACRYIGFTVSIYPGTTMMVHLAYLAVLWACSSCMRT